MKNIKIILILLATFLLSGCASTYELEIDGENFNEKITTYIYQGDRENSMYDDESTAGRIDAFVERDVYTYFEDYTSVYEKSVSVINDYEQVVLNFKYKAEEYKNSNAINLCFENKVFEIEEENYNIDLTGYFYCLYDNDSVSIEIKTDNEVLNHNAHEQIGNRYIWRIDESNFKNVDVKMQLGKVNKKTTIYLVVAISIVAILVFLIFLKIIKKLRKVNEI